MHCRHCNALIPVQAAFCTACGCPPRTGRNYCHNCGALTTPAQVVCVQCGYALPAANAAGFGAKSKVVAGLLGIFIGSLGIHRFYLGYTGIGVLQILLTLVTCGAAGLWGFIEGILILVGVGIVTDAQGQPLVD